VLENGYIRIAVDNKTGRFGIRTVEGQPIRKNDQSVDMLFRGDDPETSFTTFRINGTDYIFGNPYKFSDTFFSEISKPRIVNNSNGSRQIETVWTIEGVSIKQILMLYSDPSDKLNSGNVNIRYEVTNRSGAQVQVGTRILLDTMVGGNDGPAMQIGTAYGKSLTVERKLVHDPVVPEGDVAYWKLPPYWVMKDSLDPTNPLATNVTAYGFNNFSEGNVHIVDEMIVGHWNGLANTKWDYTPNGNLDFTRDTNDYGTADSAVAFYWEPDPIPNKGTLTYETVYGLGEIIEQDKVFSIRFIDTPQQLATLPDNSDYANQGVFELIAEIENLPMYDMEHESLHVKLTLESGLSFVKLDGQGNVVTDNGKVQTESYRDQTVILNKPATPEEAAAGITPMYKPGETVTKSFLVKANGRPWPTNKEYLLTVGSPQTRAKIEGVQDEGLLAQYESSKANFILLPAVGEAVPTYAYGLSPKELFSTDQKLITVNLTNLDAYNTGNALAEPNFDLFLKEKVTGRRYKVPVKNSVILQPTDDGYSGDMRISYSGGDEVDKNGNVIRAGLGPELPLGQYQVEIDFKGDTGGDAEIAAMYDITTSQTFVVSDNPANRIRQANIVAVYKEYVDVFDIANGAGATGSQLDEINGVYTWKPFASTSELNKGVDAFKQARTKIGVASNAADPKLKLDKFLAFDTYRTVPVYQYRLFDSEQELTDFFAIDRDGNRVPDHEKLVVIRGMIKQVGTGAEQQVVVETATEPAVINDAVAYKGKDIVFVRGQLEMFNIGQINGYKNMPFLDTLTVKGEGTLSVANSGYTFHKGEWTLDFFNGFEKRLGEKYVIPNEVFPESDGNPEDRSLNGSLGWAIGTISDRVNPLRQVMIEHVYFNRQSLFAAPTFSVSGFQFSFNDYILRPGGISFGGTLSVKVLEAEVRNVIFNNKGFVGVDAALKYELGTNIGLFGPKKSSDQGGELFFTHYVQPVQGISNRYGFKFKADLKEIAEVQAELSLKKVADGRILPDVIAFGVDLDKPIPISAATYLKGVRGALRELADTIAGGTPKDPFPLVIQAGITLRFGVTPAYHFGDIDLTLKRTGFALRGELGFSPKADPDDDELLPMITEALLQAQWATPWFVKLEAEVNVLGWGVIVGKAGIFVGQNLEKNRIDFEGYIGAKIQIPESVPIVGGIPLASVFFGLNNEKVWGSVGVLLITLGVTYYWGGGIEFGTDGKELPEGMLHLVVNDPEQGPRLLVIGQGVETVATSWIDAEREAQEVVYREVAEGIEIIDNGTMNVGIGGIEVKNAGREHLIPMTGVRGNALIEMEYTDSQMPGFTLKDAQGKLYPVVFDNSNTNPNANAFTQFIPASVSSDGTDSRKAYIIVPADKAASGGTWTLTAVSPVETKLLNVPVAPQLKDVKLTKSGSDANVFTARWAVDNAKPGDTVSLYLAEDAVTSAKTQLEDGVEVLEPGDAGMLIAKDLPVASGGGLTGVTTNGSAVIDVTQVSLLGDIEDIRGLLRQGNYYLRVELKSDAAFATKTSVEKFEIVDPLAPSNVSDVVIVPAGNGLFALSFKPGPVKAGQGAFERSYAIAALQERGGKLEEYPNFGELLYTEDELADYWNPASGKYEGILLGGWDASTTSAEIDTESLNGTKIGKEEVVQYTGLEVGQEYVIGVSAVSLPTEEADKNGNYHYASRADSVKKLLPVPAKPKLSAVVDGQKLGEPFIELMTNRTKQTVMLEADQQHVAVEAFYKNQSIGRTSLINKTRITGEGAPLYSEGTLSFDEFTTDGTYAIELVSTNTVTGDRSVRMLYLTVDTIAPMIYIEEPVTGQRTVDGKLAVAGTTNNDAVLTVNGTAMQVAEDGTFSGYVNVPSDEPTVDLAFVARDGAGNENRAVVNVVSDQFKAPVGLVLRNIASMHKGDTRQIEAVVRYASGKTTGGEPLFEEVVVPPDAQDKLHYSIDAGDAVRLSADGKLTGIAVGASLVKAEYRVAEGVTLEATAIASVDVPAPAEMGRITAYTSAISGANNRTKVVVSDAGDMTGYQLVYKVFSSGAAVVLPVFGQQLDGWSYFPANYEVTAAPGDTVVVAKQSSLQKKAAALSAKLVANVWTQPGGSFGGGGGGVFQPPVVNDNPASAERSEDMLTIRLAAKDVEAERGKEIKVVAGDVTVTTYKFSIEQALAKQAAEYGQPLRIELPDVQLTIAPAMLANAASDVEFIIRPNNVREQSALRSAAAGLKASALGDGQGFTIETNLPQADWTSYVPAQIAVPKDVRLADITAVLLQGPDGSWTPVPWKLRMVGGNAYVDTRLSGEGHLFFVRNTPGFKDVGQRHWALKSIQEAAAGLMVMGKGQGIFDPDSLVTRAEYPTMLLRSAGLMNRTASATFTDVGTNAWYRRSVAIAAELGIANGRDDGTFGPQETMTRIEAMTMAGRLMEAMGLAGQMSEDEIGRTLGAFADEAAIPQWARRPVALSVKYGIIMGVGQAIKPSEALTRAQAAAIAARLNRWIADNR